MKFLYLDENQISDISALANLTGLGDLDLSGNQINDITMLANLTGLWELYLSGNKSVIDLTPGGASMAIIKNLIDNRVEVDYQPQKTSDPDPDPDPIKFGDPSGDGQVNIEDAILVLKSVVNLAKLSDRQKFAGDVNGDGKVDVNDAILILRHVVNLITEFPVEAEFGWAGSM